MSAPKMKISSIAERTLTCIEHPRQKVIVRLGKPTLNAKAKDYECAYQITGKGVNLTRSAAGLDAIQAIQSAFTMIGAEISRIEMASGIHLRFGDLEGSGFPFINGTH